MNDNFRKSNLYILSLGLLFIFLIIITLDVSKVNFDITSIDTWRTIGLSNLVTNVKDFQVWKEIVVSNYVAIFSMFMLIYCFYGYKKFEFDLNGTTDIPFEVKKIESINYEHLTFLATYIIPLISFDFESTRQMIVFGLLLAVMGIIYIKTDLFYANPSLALLGFFIYKADGSFKYGNKDGIVIISREKIIAGQKLLYIKLDDRIYYTKGIST